MLDRYHKKSYGTYDTFKKHITIYVKRHESVEELISSIIHETVHFKQYQQNPRGHLKKYNKLLNTVGYKNHPMEIEAETIAEQKLKPCIKFLIKNDIIS